MHKGNKKVPIQKLLTYCCCILALLLFAVRDTAKAQTKAQPDCVLTITSKYSDVTMPVNSACPALMPDFLVNPTATDNCTNTISFSQYPGFGSPITGTAPITVTITATDGLGNTAKVSFILTPQDTPLGQPSVTIKPTTGGIICPGTAISFSPTPVKAINPTYEWFVNGNSKGIGPYLTSNAFVDGDMVTCIMTCSVLCGNLTTVTSPPVTVHVSEVSGPVVTVLPQQVSVCAGIPVNFTASLNNTFPKALYQWQVNGVDAGTNSPAFTTTGLKDGDLVTCTVIGNAGCLAPATSLPVTVHISPLPQISYENNITIKSGNSVQLQPVNAVDIVSYLWSPAIGLSTTTVADPVASPQVTTAYSVTVTNAGGCQKTIAVTVNVINQINIPNIFTPNNDGINDSWNIVLLSGYNNCVIDVFNRYGKAVYHSAGYSKAWDGSYRGNKIAPGTYYYVIDLGDGSKKLAGYVEVVY